MDGRVLIIDDDPLVLKSISAVLKSIGCAVFEALSGEDALAVLKHNDLDLVVSDIRMPGMSGIEVVRRIRSQENANRNVPVIIITGYSGYEKYHDDKALGVIAVFQKPFDTEEFVKVVKKSISEMNTVL